jgi:hypothetical protein
VTYRRRPSSAPLRAEVKEGTLAANKRKALEAIRRAGGISKEIRPSVTPTKHESAPIISIKLTGDKGVVFPMVNSSEK